ncbi:hypothetical protein T10_12947 [Trichinella papuae]|uniref:Uncharacterized protein n=1 Tax=Trichinella papuae TaxID=268474 RepID=A0A0V1N4K6_9BILA|nr:hypothetical protein T10_12947 [Trichinella papuae]
MHMILNEYIYYRRIDDLRGISGHISKFSKTIACCNTPLSYQISLSKITVQRYRTLNAVLGYALALRGGGAARRFFLYPPFREFVLFLMFMGSNRILLFRS